MHAVPIPFLETAGLYERRMIEPGRQSRFVDEAAEPGLESPGMPLRPDRNSCWHPGRQSWALFRLLFVVDQAELTTPSFSGKLSSSIAAK
jgi:hypothetical protein